LGDRRGGLRLTIDEQPREMWLDRADNRREWARLCDALMLAEGFVFLPAQCGDRVAEEFLGELLAERAAEMGVGLIARPLTAQTRVTDVLAELRDAPYPRVFWFSRGDSHGVELDEFFSLLNQKREAVSQLAAAPVVMSMHRLDWGHFRRHAPDFWSIHQAVFRFSPGKDPKRSSVDVNVATSTDFSIDRRRDSRHGASGWRLHEKEFAAHPNTRFVGRRTELESLVSMLYTPGARVAVFGARGMGKTTLLRQACVRVAENYPDGIWWIPFETLPGDSRERTRLILTRLLNELGASSHEEEDPSMLQRRFRAATNSRKILLVVDDVDDPGVVDALRPGAWASLVVSSSKNLDGPDFTGALTLGPLSAEAGASLLLERTRLDEDMARRLTAALGGNPAMISAIAVQAAKHPRAVEQLLEFAAREGPLDEALEVGMLRALPPALESPWTALGVFEGEFDVADAAALSLDRDALETLTQHGFVEPVSAESFRIPPLLLELARRRLVSSPDSFHTWLAYARRVLVDRKPLAETADARSAIDWIRTQRDGQGNVPDSVWALAADAIVAWVEVTSAEFVFDGLEDVARARHASYHEALISLWRARQAARQVDLERAARAARDALDLMRSAEEQGMSVPFSSDGHARVYLGLAQVELGRRKLDEAERAAEQGLTHAAAALEGGHANLVRSDLHQVLGRIAYERNDAAAAEQLFEKALDEARAAGEFGEPAAAELCLSLGFLAREVRGDTEAAQRWLEEAATGWERLGDLHNLMRALRELSLTAWARGDVELAVQYATRGQKLATELGDDSSSDALAEMLERFRAADD
jgi:tetratricopeptide (TPR) repeat protein